MTNCVSESINFPDEEDKVYKMWKEIDAFQLSLKLSKRKPRYVFIF